MFACHLGTSHSGTASLKQTSQGEVSDKVTVYDKRRDLAELLPMMPKEVGSAHHMEEEEGGGEEQLLVHRLPLSHVSPGSNSSSVPIVGRMMEDRRA